MVPADLDHVRALLASGRILDPVLELGAGYGGPTCREVVEASGRSYLATDATRADGVDVVADLESGDGLEGCARRGPFGTALVLNVLEHVLEPALVLDRVRSLLRPAGTIVAITPAAWPIHSFPVDCARLLPDWYRRYAATRGLAIDEETFCYVGYGPVSSFHSVSGEERLPPAGSGNELHRAWSRIVHSLFGTFGRDAQHLPRVAVGAVLRLPG